MKARQKFLRLPFYTLSLMTGVIAMDQAYAQEAATPAQKKDYQVYVLPYVGYMTYSNALNRPDRFLTGLYSYLGVGQHSLELQFDYERSHKNSQFLNHYHQEGYTAVYTNYQISNTELKAGAHYINNHDYGHSTTGLVGGAYYFTDDNKNREGRVGATYHYSDYKRPLGTGNHVQQLTIRGNRYLSVSGGLLDLGAGLDGIHLGTSVQGKRKNYLSGRLSADYSYGQMKAGIFSRFGDAPYLTDKNAFIVFNDDVMNRYGFGAEIGWQFTPDISVKFDYENNRLKTFGDHPLSGNANKYLLSTGFRF